MILRSQPIELTSDGDRSHRATPYEYCCIAAAPSIPAGAAAQGVPAEARVQLGCTRLRAQASTNIYFDNPQVMLTLKALVPFGGGY